MDKQNGIGKRLIDGVIVLGKKKYIQCGGTYNLEAKDIICIQTKRARLGMYLLGQAFFSRKILSWRLSNTLDTEFCISAFEECCSYLWRTSNFQ
jgi:Fe-S cluster assembly ATPase SufC